MAEKENIVKARLHHGSNSLDLTIPSDVVKTFKVNPGDVFRLVTSMERDAVVLKYERVYAGKGN